MSGATLSDSTRLSWASTSPAAVSVGAERWHYQGDHDAFLMNQQPALAITRQPFMQAAHHSSPDTQGSPVGS